MGVDESWKKFNVRGGVTYSDFTYAKALVSNENSKDPKYKKKPEDVAPTVQLLLEPLMEEKLVAFLRDVYLPEALARGLRGEKKDAFDKKTVDRILKQLAEGHDDGWETTPPHLPIKKVYHKTKEIAPWAVGTLKFAGNKGQDIELLAAIKSEDELKVPDPDRTDYPALVPIGLTVHELYPGAWAYATLNLSGFISSPSNFGISAYATKLAWLEDRDKLSGGSDIDTEDIFMDE